MKKLTVVLLISAFLISGIGIFSPAEAQTETIASQAIAEQLAADAGGSFITGTTAPALTGTQVALPVVSQATGETLGFVVAEKASLVGALNAAGLTEVAAAVSATAAGSVAGVAAATGLALGTTGTVALAVAAVAGIALAVGSDNDSTSTTTHTTTAHH